MTAESKPEWQTGWPKQSSPPCGDPAVCSYTGYRNKTVEPLGSCASCPLRRSFDRAQRMWLP